MTPYEFASILVAALGLLGGVIGFFRSIAAGRRSAEAEAEAADAQADAAAALRKSAAADERIARALEAIAQHEGAVGARATPTEPHHAGGAAGAHVDTEAGTEAVTGEDVRARLEALIPEQVVRWQVEGRPEPGTFRLRNFGSVSATAVTVESDPNRAAPSGSGPDGQAGATLLPGQALIFRASGQTRVLRVRWSDKTSDAARLATVPIPEPGDTAQR